MEDEIGWLWIHGTSAGCASIMAWEGLAGVISGPVLMVVFGGITFVSLHLVARHHRKEIIAARRPPKRSHTLRADPREPLRGRGGRLVRR